MEKATCTKCKEDKELTEFYVSKKKKSGRQSVCKACESLRARSGKERERSLKYYREHAKEINKESKKWRDSHPEKCAEYRNNWKAKNKEKVKLQAKELNLLKFGLTIDSYNSLLFSQNNVCAICGEEEVSVDNRTGNKRALAVDHNHETGAVRGLLCDRCNRGLGYFKDRETNLLSAFLYLSKGGVLS